MPATNKTKLRTAALIAIVAALLVAGAPGVRAGSSGLGLPNAGASIQQLHNNSTRQFRDSAATTRNDNNLRRAQRQAREEALAQERHSRRKQIQQDSLNVR